MLFDLLSSLRTGLTTAIAACSAVDPNLRAPIAISLGAVPGALCRYYLGGFCSQWLGITFPFGTFFVNLTGALLMGFFVTFTLDRAISSPELRLLIAVGFLGSYTTFSSYELDTVTLWRSGQRSLTLFYWLGSAVFGFIFLELGSLIARKLS